MRRHFHLTLPRFIGSLVVCVAFAFAFASPIGEAYAGKKRLIDHGDGTWSIEVRANFTPQGLGALEVTSADEQDYCEIFRNASQRLWTLTNGQHYFDSVTFGYGATETDVFLVKGDRSFANGNRILLQFKNPHPSGADALHSQTLAHEWGHYFYGLPDEYSQARDLGWCANGRYNSPSESCSVFPTTSCPDGARCIRHDTCVNEGGLYDGFVLTPGDPLDEATVDAWGVVSESQCAAAGGSGPHPVCVLYDPTGAKSFAHGGPKFWPNWGASCAVHADCDTAEAFGDGRCTQQLPTSGFERAICNGATSCIMSSYGETQHWCDGASHVHFNEDGVSLSHNNSVLYTARTNPHMHGAEDYNCWDQAKSVWGSLQFNGQYDDVGLAPNAGDPDFCTWNVPDHTDFDLADWSMLVIDASGSMGADANGVPGWTYAVDGAEYFNQVAFDKGTQAGIYGFGGEMWPIQWAKFVGDEVQKPAPATQEMVLGHPMNLSQPDIALYRDAVQAHVEGGHPTNLCAVLEGSKRAFEEAKAPAADRQVVLLTDAKFNVLWKTPEAECRGVDAWIQLEPSIASQICSEANMRVNVIATGASPNIEYAQLLADNCNGWMYYAGDEHGDDAALPHAAKVYAAMSKAMVAGDRIALHERAPLEATSDSELHEVRVPPGTATLDVAWIGSAAVSTASPSAQAFDALGFSLESPSGDVMTPSEDASERKALYRRLSIASPEPGAWTMRVDKSQLRKSSRAQVDVGWLASIDHPYFADAWVERAAWSVGDEVTIFGSVTDGEYGLGGLQVSARIASSGQSWELALFDDGEHGDGPANDGVYAAKFSPTVAGPYAIKLNYEVVPGMSHTIPGEPIFGGGPGPEAVSHSASLVAHTTFEARHGRVGLVRTDLPPLERGSRHSKLSATIQGLLVPTPGVAVSLGPGVTVLDLNVECVICANAQTPVEPADLVYQLTFDVGVSADAPVGQRDLLVEIGFADYVLAGATSVVVVDDADADADADRLREPLTAAVPGCGCVTINAGLPGSLLGAASIIALFGLGFAGIQRRVHARSVSARGN